MHASIHRMQEKPEAETMSASVAGYRIWIELVVEQLSESKEEKGAQTEVGEPPQLSCMLWYWAMSLSVPPAEGSHGNPTRGKHGA